MSNLNYMDVVNYLESLQLMPKTMPGLVKIKKALESTEWYSQIDPKKVIVVAGTNGKGTTCSMLSHLLVSAGQKVGFYSSPHLVSTTERIRIQNKSITELEFINIFCECEQLIKKYELSHFEALTLMAGHYFFSEKWNLKLDYIIFEVGLGGSFDATNAFPHHYSVITPIDFDHTNILGNSLVEIAANKFGIIQKDNCVIYQPLAETFSLDLKNQILELQNTIQQKTNSIWHQVNNPIIEIKKEHSQIPIYHLKTEWGSVSLSLLGSRAAQNAMTALTTFFHLGFFVPEFINCLSEVNWPGRMQKIEWSGIHCPVYLSGDHNPQGVRSLIDILNNFSWKRIYLIVGIGADKDSEQMFSELLKLSNLKLFLTETPFKGKKINEYNLPVLVEAKNADPIQLLNQISKLASNEDLVVVTGSLYLVGQILREITSNK